MVPTLRLIVDPLICLLKVHFVSACYSSGASGKLAAAGNRIVDGRLANLGSKMAPFAQERRSFYYETLLERMHCLDKYLNHARNYDCVLEWYGGWCGGVYFAADWATGLSGFLEGK